MEHLTSYVGRLNLFPPYTVFDIELNRNSTNYLYCKNRTLFRTIWWMESYTWLINQ